MHRPRAAGKMLSHEQVAALLAQAERRNTTDVTVVEQLATSEGPNNPAATSAVSAITEQKGVKNSDGVEDPTQVDIVDRSLIQETSRVEVVTRKLSDDSDSTADRNDNEVSDVLVLLSSGGEPTEGQCEDHVIRKQDHVSQPQGSGDHQQQQDVDDQPKEATKETVQQPEADHNATNSSSSLADKAAPPNTTPTHTSSTSKAKSSKYVSQGSMFAELQLHGTSTTSIQPAMKNKVAPWCRQGQQRNSWSHDDHVTSKSSELNHLQSYEEEEVSCISVWCTVKCTVISCKAHTKFGVFH